MNYKVNFLDSNKIKQNYSQAGQDLFVLQCLNGKKSGTFLDLGCHTPIKINNTYLLETEYSWNGLSLDIVDFSKDYETNRKCKFLQRDCTNLNFDEIEFIVGSNIDYLSIDLEPANFTLKALMSIPFDKFSFKIITFEHDCYRFGPTIKQISRDFLTSKNYHLLCSDVRIDQNNFEDWYVNLNIDNFNNLNLFQCDNKDYREIIINN